MSRVYSPYLGRYVMKLASQVGSVYNAHTRSLASPLVASGDIASYGFPSDAEVGVEAPWNCDVKNTGTDGVIGFGIVNNGGNPGNIVVKFGGKDVTLEPGYYWRVYTVDPVPNGTHLIASGKVVFLAEGSHTVRLWGMHPEGETWYYDEEITRTVSVAPSDGGGGGQEWPYEAPPLILANALIVKAEGWDLTGKYVDLPPFHVGDAEKYLGARLMYTIQSRSSPKAVWQPTSTIDVNGWNVVKIVNFPRGGVRTSEVDISTLVAGKGNKIKLGQSNLPGSWSEFAYTVKVVLGYSSKPDTDPGVDEDPWAWVKENWMWLAGGGVVLGGIYLFTRRGQQPLIVMTQPYYPREKGE